MGNYTEHYHPNSRVADDYQTVEPNQSTLDIIAKIRRDNARIAAAEKELGRKLTKEEHQAIVTAAL